MNVFYVEAAKVSLSMSLGGGSFQTRPMRRKSIGFVGEVPTVFGFAVIISTVGSYQVRVCFINSSRLSLVSVACGSYRIIIISTGSL